MTRWVVLPSRLVTLSAFGRDVTFAAQWPASLDPLRGSSPCRRFALPLAGHDARLGGDVTRYVFIVEDLHLLLLAGLPAHYQLAERMTRGTRLYPSSTGLTRGSIAAPCRARSTGQARG
jgi:hypothetical protein